MKCFLGTVFILLAAPIFSFANSQSQVYLRDALHYYHFGNYEKAKKYFAAVLTNGSAKEQSIAKRYLAKPELKTWSRNRSLDEQLHGLLQRGMNAYDTHHYEDARQAFNQMLKIGPPAAQRVARRYLRQPQMQPESEDILPQESPAPEQEKDITEEAKENAEPFQLSGYLREEIGYRVSAPQQLSLLRSTAFTSGTGQISDGVTYKVSGRFYYDAVFDLTHHYPQAVADDEKTDAELRDTYVDISKGNWDARLGKQQVVWGEAIGTFIADVVNARDLRESVLPSYDFIRIPQWGTDIEYSKNDLHLEGVWLPAPVMDKIPRPGSEFAPLLPVIPGYQLAFRSEKDPSDSLDNGEIGARISYLLSGWDMSVFHFRTWDKAPVYFRSVTPGLITLSPDHPRITYDGATFSKELEHVVLKGEATYTQGKYLSTTDFTSATGVVQKNIIQYLLGADHTFNSNVQLSFQLSQQIIQGFESDIFQQDAKETSLSMRITRPFWNDRLEPSFETITDLPYKDYLLRPYVGFKWASHWSTLVGFDVFGGAMDGPFGQFRDRSRAYAEIRYDFGTVR